MHSFRRTCMRKMNAGWGLMALPWMMVAVCVFMIACSRTPVPEKSQQFEDRAPQAVSARSTPVGASPPNIPSEALPDPISEKALAIEASEQDQQEQDEMDVEYKAKSVPDNSYVDAPLRSSYVACVKESRGMTPELEMCGEQEYAYHEEKFRAAVAKIMGSPDGVEKDRVLDELAAWWEDTEKYCSWDPETEGQGQMLDAQSCRLNRVANHAPEVEKIAQNLTR